MATEELAVRILLVEDNPGDARLVYEMLEEGGEAYSLLHVKTLGDALEHLAAHPEETDVVLLDLSLPDESGLETLRRTLEVPHTAGVVVMTGLGDDEVGVAAAQAGAQDYLVKGQVDYRALRRALKLALARHKRAGALETQSLTDDLTGLNNRRGFLVNGEQQLALARRNQQPIAVLFVDLDDFKRVNDKFGHAEGDRALIETANVMKRSMRDSDVKARIGGDEFVGLAINASEQSVSPIRTRLENALKAINRERQLPYDLTFSVGIFHCPAEDESSVEQLLARADALMYEDKRRKQAATPARKPTPTAVR
jgi:two-component system cell cycle response regulator